MHQGVTGPVREAPDKKGDGVGTQEAGKRFLSAGSGAAARPRRGGLYGEISIRICSVVHGVVSDDYR
jgi:hypothetical protein